ncbi:MAG: homoaconitate hydratase [Candidatus Riflebacteria bacterium RBG_13_59_9]|nr:MAG: homoaconitate hydratase [Candidatus Riflebacteria bacterium RBG_13_59_9]
MGQTIIEGIVSAGAGRPVRAGEVVWLPQEVVTARDFAGANVVKNFREAYGETARVFDPSGILFTFDCNAPANTVGYATNQQICRDFARSQGIRVHDVDAGIGSHLLIEQGLALPGVTAIGTDSHYNILGAVGALGQGMGDIDVAFAFRNGKVWFEVPPTVRVNIRGHLAPNACAKDLTLAVVRHFGSDGLLGCAAELYGEVVEALDLPERITLASMATEMGAVVMFLPPSEEVLVWLSKRAGRDVQGVAPTADADYAEEVTLDLGNIEPMIAEPYSPARVRPVRELETEGVLIDTGFIGSCTNGRFEDFSAAYAQLAGSRVADGVTLKLVPATREVYGQMLKAGLIERFFDAGALIHNQGCGGCAAGQVGMTGEGEVQVSTSNRNFRGKQGAGRTYLASPATVAASVRAGRITVPEVTR